MKYCYTEKRFGKTSQTLIEQVDSIMREYAAQGYDMTLRQVYYKLVARDLFPEDRRWRKLESGKWIRDPNGTKNAEPNYKWLGVIVNDGRLAGLLDWDQMVDRTREIRHVSHWESPSEILRACADQFRVDTRQGQEYLECWVEKEAMAGIVVPICQELDIPCLVDRGFVSQSAMYYASKRFANGGTILYLGDHDPSGIDMSRDVDDRLNRVFTTLSVTVERLALNMDQVEEYNPPPNPAKEKDSRYDSYREQYGDDCWELDALEPSVIAELIRDGVARHTNPKVLNKHLNRQKKGREELNRITRDMEGKK